MSHKYEKMSYGYKKLKNIIIRDGIKVCSMYIIKSSLIFNLETI